MILALLTRFVQLHYLVKSDYDFIHVHFYTLLQKSCSFYFSNNCQLCQNFITLFWKASTYSTIITYLQVIGRPIFCWGVIVMTADDT